MPRATTESATAEARPADGIPVDDAGTATLKGLFADRFSCRAFRPWQVPREEIEAVLDIARRTPSWCNTQPWHVHITEGEETVRLRERLTGAVAADPLGSPDIAFPAAYEGEFQERRRRSGWQLYEALGIAKGDRAASGMQALRNFDFFDAPHVAIVTTEAALGTYGAVDCGLFVQSFLLAAHSRGIATIPQAALATQSAVLREHLGLGEDRQVLIGISFGYPDLAHPANSYRTERRTSDDVVTFVGE